MPSELECFHEHLGMRYFAGQQEGQCFRAALIGRELDQRLVGLPSACLGGDVGAQIADYIAALVDISRGPGLSAAVHQMRPHAAHCKQRAAISAVPGIAFLGVLLDHSPDHLEMAELFESNVMQHVADGLVLDVEGLGPIGQRGAELAGSAAELLQQHLPKTRIGALNFDVVHQLFAVEKHVTALIVRSSRAPARLSLGTGWRQARFQFHARSARGDRNARKALVRSGSGTSTKPAVAQAAPSSDRAKARQQNRDSGRTVAVTTARPRRAPDRLGGLLYPAGFSMWPPNS